MENTGLAIRQKGKTSLAAKKKGGAAAIALTFIRKRTLVWVCDIEKSSTILNDIRYINEAEEFLKRFYALTSILVRVTGGIVYKGTGDGFLAAYEVALDRDLGREAGKIFAAAWHLTRLISATQLGVACPKRFKIRHGIALEPDSILIEHNTTQIKLIDIIGRGVVLTFRLAGIKVPFPSIVTQKNLVDAAAANGCNYTFHKMKFSHEDLLKYFKGEKWSTNKVYASADSSLQKGKAPAPRQGGQKTTHALSSGIPLSEQQWLSDLYHELLIGAPWAQQAAKKLDEIVRVRPLAAPRKKGQARG
jgi:class 3 adenylate cyclase